MRVINELSRDDAAAAGSTRGRLGSDRGTCVRCALPIQDPGRTDLGTCSRITVASGCLDRSYLTRKRGDG